VSPAGREESFAPFLSSLQILLGLKISISWTQIEPPEHL